MAVVPMGSPITNTYLTTGANRATNVREDLADIIYETNVTETPAVSAIGVGNDARQVQTDWLTEELAAADVNRQKEGFTYAAQPVVRATRLSNVCQIMARTITVSNTLIASDTVGTENEFERQMINKGLEVRRDLEYAITRPTPKDPVDPRAMAGIPAYITNGSVGTGGTMPVGDGTAANVPGTARDLTLTLIADAMEAAFVRGGRPDLGLVNSALKRIFSGLAAGGAGNEAAMDNILQATTPKPATYVGAVDSYLTDFGTVDLAIDLFMPQNLFLLLDPDYAELAPLPGRNMIVEEYARTGDAQNGGVVYEGCVRVTAPQAHAAIFDLNT